MSEHPPNIEVDCPYCGKKVITGLGANPSCHTCGKPFTLKPVRIERAIEESRGEPDVIGESCPTCGCKYLGEMGDGDYSCAGCGMGMQEPCEHWKAMLAALPDPPKGNENV